MTAIQVPPTRAGSRILGVGGYRPERIVTNAEICTMIDSSDEWIRERSGIVERRWAGPDESVADMATDAAGKALAHAGVDASEVDVVLVSTVSHFLQTPSAAVEVADRIGTAKAAAYDISAACAGFCYGLAQADALVRTGTAGYVVVVGVERLSDITDSSDRSTAFIFADGAGAVVVGPSATPGIGPVAWGADGSERMTINMTQSWHDYMASPGKHPALTMQGQAVFRWAVREVTQVARDAIAKAGLEPSDIDVFLPHQANNRITDAMLKALKLREDIVVARDIITSGNTSAASIPLALERLVADGAYTSGATALMVGFGAGLTYAGQVVTLP